MSNLIPTGHLDHAREVAKWVRDRLDSPLPVEREEAERIETLLNEGGAVVDGALAEALHADTADEVANNALWAASLFTEIAATVHPADGSNGVPGPGVAMVAGVAMLLVGDFQNASAALQICYEQTGDAGALNLGMAAMIGGVDVDGMREAFRDRTIDTVIREYEVESALGDVHPPRHPSFN